MSDKSRLRSPVTIVTLAVLAGLVAGAVAVYVSNRSPGNNVEQANACRDKTGIAKTVGDAATGEVAAMAASDPRLLNDLTFDGPDGKHLSIADFAGKTILLNLWATWCSPCRAEMPALDRLQQEKGSDDFEVVAVNVEKGSKDKARAFLAEVGVEHLAFYRDETVGLFNELKKRALALGLPVTLLIDEDGCLLANMNGPAAWDSDDAKRLIDTALGAS